MILFLICLFSFLASYNRAGALEFTLPGDCPKNITILDKFDSAKFAGTWYTVGVFASDSRETNDCSMMLLQEDNIGFTLKEKYVDVQDNRTEKFYNARVDPTFDADDTAKFVVSYEDGDKVMQFPFVILSSDYTNYAIAYTCKGYKGRPRKHYVFCWILSRTKDKLEGEELAKLNSILSQYHELKEHLENFVLKDFSDTSCAFTNELKTDHFTNNFW